MNLTDALHNQPYLVHLGLEVVELKPYEVALRLPLRREVSNHLGLVHGGAQYGLGEATAIAMAILIFREKLPNLNALTARANIIYQRAAQGDLIGRASFAADTADRMRAQLGAKGKARFLVYVVLNDETGAPVTHLTVDCVVSESR